MAWHHCNVLALSFPPPTVVTGSTDGIGKEYAKELAKRGMNLVLISRSMDKLQKVSTEIVNNVGVMLSHPMEFELASEKDIWSHVNVNVASVPAMSKIVLPGMLSRGRGAVVNLASIAGYHPIPLMGIYSATKAFVDYFSQAMAWEYRGSGITVQTLTPSYVSTNMTKFSELVHKPSLLIPTAATYAASAIHTLGYAGRTAGYWVHCVQHQPRVASGSVSRCYYKAGWSSLDVSLIVALSSAFLTSNKLPLGESQHGEIHVWRKDGHGPLSVRVAI
ncbi:Hydroxysteroid dehydrogenase-like protein 1 [Portunus trituberculatus]|uniref:Hydroxysteroid dehydrogenase-like protein 1 n=1 Tax=Portunus trituberculatus TaxID=210409 RepID=A0A5B7FB85_PORTR|nr:Hydroxysteroid dehydrogenase-like protein 1 [Portunus trituberculatus]